MARNLDITALRALDTVAATGGVTRAAERLNLTQSAVSMQVKRLEEALGRTLLDRTGRGVALTAEGELLRSYARRILDLNDEVWLRLTDAAHTGELALGVPHDIVHPHVPTVLRAFARAFPRVRVTLESSYTRTLKARFAEGALDAILTTEDSPAEGGVDAGEALDAVRLVWVGAPGGKAWRQRPLRLAFENVCVFRGVAIATLDAAGIPWEMAVTSDSTRSIEVAVAADLAVHALAEPNVPTVFEPIRHAGALPDLPEIWINLYLARDPPSPALAELARLLREAYGGTVPRTADPVRPSSRRPSPLPSAT